MYNDVCIRPAALEDAGGILEIYRYYVLHTAVSFEYEAPALEEFQARMARTMSKYPYFVAARGERILGYAYAGAFVGRTAYNWSAELTIYLAPEERGRGLGKRLYQALEGALREMGVLNLYACIGYPEREDEYLTENSARFHGHMGFRLVGTFRQCGYKFGRWYHMVWMEKLIGAHRPEQPAVTPWPEIFHEN